MSSHPRAPRHRVMRTVSLTALGLSLVLLGGCAGHGNYTTEGMTLANQRARQLKSGTEWNMARQSFLAGNLKKALAGVERSLAVNPYVPKSHVLHARILIEMGRLGEALKALALAGELDPEFVDAYYYRGIIFERLLKLDKAFDAYSRAVEIEPERAQFAVAATEVLIDQGAYDQARAFIEDRSEQFEHNAGSQQTLGHIAMILHEFDKAVMHFNEARLLAPDEPTIVEDMVDASVAAGQFAQAEFYVARLLEMPDLRDRRDLQHLRAKCLIELDRPVEARTILLKLTRGPSASMDIEAWLDLGHVSYVLNDGQTLRRAASRVGAARPLDPRSHVLKTLASRARGNTREALVHVARAIELTPQADAPLLTLKGMIQLDMGHRADAASSFKAAARVDPSNKIAIKMLATINSINATVPADGD